MTFFSSFPPLFPFLFGHSPLFSLDFYFLSIWTFYFHPLLFPFYIGNFFFSFPSFISLFYLDFFPLSFEYVLSSFFKFCFVSVFYLDCFPFYYPSIIFWLFPLPFISLLFLVQVDLFSFFLFILFFIQSWRNFGFLFLLLHPQSNQSQIGGVAWMGLSFYDYHDYDFQKNKGGRILNYETL